MTGGVVVQAVATCTDGEMLSPAERFQSAVSRGQADIVRELFNAGFTCEADKVGIY